ncbi:MAG: hypothetical protein ABW047_07510 [Nitrospiraceae bacterium]
MPLIWCSISAHGFGHAAQIVPVLNALGKQVRGLTVILRTTVPSSFFEPRLHIPWQRSPATQDIGCIQQGPLTIDVAKTWAAHRSFHENWHAKVQTEAGLIRAAAPVFVLSDISHLAIAGGAEAGVPALGLCSLSWDLVLANYIGKDPEAEQCVMDCIREAYEQAVGFIRVTPGLPMKTFHHIYDVGPIGEPDEPQADALRTILGASDSDCVVLVGFGGIQLETLPFDTLDAMAPFRFIVGGPVPPGLTRVVSNEALPFSFKTVMASVDLIMTKPGYGTIVEAVALQKPVVYVRRYNFADEQSLVDYLHRYGRGAELTVDDFLAGRWKTTLSTAWASASPPYPPPPLSGASEAASLLTKYF